MKTVLYVEDDKDTADVCKLILEAAGYKVDLAYTGKTGLEMITTKNYDLILLDIMLPDLSGWDIFQKINNKKRKIAFLSAIAVSDERLKELKKAGLVDYITKPFTKQSLTARINKILG